MLEVKIFTLYPDLFPGPLDIGIFKKARENKIWSLKVLNIRDYSKDNHGTVDDTPFGGGSGMLLRPDILASALDENIKKGEKIIYLSPRGKKFDQNVARSLSKEKKWMLSSNKKAKKEDIEKEYDRYADGLKWQLIENFIIKDQELKVDGEELLNFTMDLMGNQYVQYGMMVPEEAELKKTAQKVLSNNEEARKINDMIYDKKVMEYLKNTLKINDKFITHEDFTKKVAELTQ